MSQSPPGPRPTPAPARWLPGAARHCAHMDASRGSAPLPRPGSGRAALHFCLHSSSSSFPPLPTPLAEKGGRGRQSGHEKKHQAGEQSKKRQRNKIKLEKKKKKKKKKRSAPAAGAGSHRRSSAPRAHNAMAGAAPPALLATSAPAAALPDGSSPHRPARPGGSRGHSAPGRPRARLPRRGRRQEERREAGRRRRRRRRRAVWGVRLPLLLLRAGLRTLHGAARRRRGVEEPRRTRRPPASSGSARL